MIRHEKRQRHGNGNNIFDDIDQTVKRNLQNKPGERLPFLQLVNRVDSHMGAERHPINNNPVMQISHLPELINGGNSVRLQILLGNFAVHACQNRGIPASACHIPLL